MSSAPPEIEEIALANERFYAAFEARDLDAMSALWERSDRALCTHPGWPTLRGWNRIASSWFALFSNSQRLQFVLTNAQYGLNGDTGWASLDENLLDLGGAASSVATLNLFVRHDDGWRVVAHHGSPIMGTV